MKLTTTDIRRYYGEKKEAQILSVPLFKYITLVGAGDPNQKDFAQAMEAMYTLTYAIKMSYKKDNPPQGYYAYKVFPLEGEWDLVDKTKAISDKSNYAYKLMIQQPDFVDEDLFHQFLEVVKKKKDNPKLSLLKYEEICDGLCCQMLHVGPYDDEPESFAKMMQYCEEQGYSRSSKLHKEIYLSDPRKCAPEKLKTLLRFKVEKSQ